MSDVTFTANNQPAPACYPADVNGMLNLIANGGLHGTVPDNAGGGIYVGSIPPSSSLTNKVWAKIDGAGRPIGMYMFYNGNWRKTYTGSYGDIKFYVGPFNGVFDGTGKGLIGGNGPYDEDGWALCNGQNGTPNWVGSGCFPAAANWNGSAWVSAVDGTGYKAAGGVTQIQIQLGNLPNIQTPLAFHYINEVGTAVPFIVASQSGDQGVMQAHATGTGADTPINTTPVFVAMGLLMFIGYA